MKSIRILLSLALFTFALVGAEPLTNENIIKMVQSGVPTEIVIKTIRTADSFQFGLLPGDLIALGQAKVPEDAIKAMASRLNAGAAPAPSVTPAPVPVVPAYVPPVTASRNAARAPRPSFAESEIPRAEIYGGYSYLSLDTKGLTSRLGFNGWEASALVNVNKLVGFEGDFSGYYRNFVNVPGFGVGAHDYLAAGGPRISFGPAFFHTLFGVDRLTGGYSASGYGYSASVSGSINSLAAIFGGGVNVKIARNWALRPSADYILAHHSTPAFNQSNIRVGGGIVYSFGR